MIPTLISQNEGKTLEFKENTNSLRGIVRTVIAFANTAGGVLVIGVRDKTHEVVGLRNALGDEENLANVFADSIRPQIYPDITIQSWRDRECVVVSVPHSVGPYYERTEGPDSGVYVRLGSTNRKAERGVIEEIRRLARNATFDEQPCPDLDTEAIDFRVASELLVESGGRKITSATFHSLSITTQYHDRAVPTVGGILLFGNDRTRQFPDAIVRCARFRGSAKSSILDQQDFKDALPLAVQSALTFVKRHTNQPLEIHGARHSVSPQYPWILIREAVINSVVHADYSLTGASVQVAIFDDRIEITNPGGLPFGMTLQAAMNGVSRLRNRVIGRVFHELGLIEQWGSGIGKMLDVCREQAIRLPTFQELGNQFRVTLFHEKTRPAPLESWRQEIVSFLQAKEQISPKRASEFWKVSVRTAHTRLTQLTKEGTLAEVSTSPKDPRKVFVLAKVRNGNWERN